MGTCGQSHLPCSEIGVGTAARKENLQVLASEISTFLYIFHFTLLNVFWFLQFV
jgi:hypothetical protein